MAELEVMASVLRQQGRELYCFGMNTTRLRQICYVTPRSQDDPKEIQRILNKKRAMEIGEYIKQENSLLPNSIVVSLTADVAIQSSGMDGIKVLRFPNDEGKFAYILDGQHRLEGFKYSDGIDFDLPVVAIYNADDGLRGKIFADINGKQERVKDTHLLALYYQIGELKPDISSVMDVITQLNTHPDSPLKGRIRMMESDKNIWVNNVGLKQWLVPHLTSGGVLALKTVAQKTQILKEYFKAAASLWPDAWGNLKQYNLCRPMGFEILMGLFGPVKHRVDLNSGHQYTKETFLSQMGPLLNATIELPGGGMLPINWERGPMGSVANSRGRTLITKKLADLLRKEDDQSNPNPMT